MCTSSAALARSLIDGGVFCNAETGTCCWYGALFSETSCFNVGVAPGVVGVLGVAPRLAVATEDVVGGVFAGIREEFDAACDAEDGDFSVVCVVGVVVVDVDIRFGTALGVPPELADAPVAEGVDTLLITWRN